jgi:hypothetical protein
VESRINIDIQLWPYLNLCEQVITVLLHCATVCTLRYVKLWPKVLPIFDSTLKKLHNQTDAILGVIQDGQKDRQKLSQIEMEMDKNNSDLAKLTGDLEQKIAKAKLFIQSTIKTQMNLELWPIGPSGQY